jgi:hypothetical protein
MIGQHALRIVFSFLDSKDRDTVYRVCKDWRKQYRWVHPVSAYMHSLANGNLVLAHELFHSQLESRSYLIAPSPPALDLTIDDLIESGLLLSEARRAVRYIFHPWCQPYLLIATTFCDVDSILFALRVVEKSLEPKALFATVMCALECAARHCSVKLLGALTNEFSSEKVFGSSPRLAFEVLQIACYPKRGRPTSPTSEQQVSCFLQFLLDDRVADQQLRVLHQERNILTKLLESLVALDDEESTLVLLRAVVARPAVAKTFVPVHVLSSDLVERAIDKSMTRAVAFMFEKCDVDSFFHSHHNAQFYVDGFIQTILREVRKEGPKYHCKLDMLRLLLMQERFQMQPHALLRAAIDSKLVDLVKVVLDSGKVEPTSWHLAQALDSGQIAVADLLLAFELKFE